MFFETLNRTEWKRVRLKYDRTNHAGERFRQSIANFDRTIMIISFGITILCPKTFLHGRDETRHEMNNTVSV
jgi:hypothetical protein